MIYAERGETEKFLGLLEEILQHHPGHKPTLGTAKKIRKKLEKKGSEK